MSRMEPPSAFPADAPLPTAVRLVEVGLRDGLQSVATTLPTARKLVLLEALLEAGLRHIQVASFVNPSRVPQMADAEALSVALRPLADAYPDATFSGLALNLRGVERLAAAGLRHVDISLSASEPHSQRNAGMSIAEATRQITRSIHVALEFGLGVRAGVQCVFGSASGEEVPVERVSQLATALLEAGAGELALADSAGLADPLTLARTVEHVRTAIGDVPLTLHLHDTRGLGMTNFVTALRLGVRSFDTAFGALGGCPFIPGAAGNIGTEDAVHLLAALGIDSGVDLAGVARVTKLAEGWLAQHMPSSIYQLVQGAAGSDHQQSREDPIATDSR